MNRCTKEKPVDLFYRLEGGHDAKTMEDHDIAANAALGRAVDAGLASYTAKENGDGVIHSYRFQSGEVPSFAPPTGDVFNQYSFG
jgi:hypothetical protein